MRSVLVCNRSTTFTFPCMSHDLDMPTAKFRRRRVCCNGCRIGMFLHCSVFLFVSADEVEAAVAGDVLQNETPTQVPPTPRIISAAASRSGILSLQVRRHAARIHTSHTHAHTHTADIHTQTQRKTKTRSRGADAPHAYTHTHTHTHTHTLQIYTRKHKGKQNLSLQVRPRAARIHTPHITHTHTPTHTHTHTLQIYTHKHKGKQNLSLQVRPRAARTHTTHTLACVLQIHTPHALAHARTHTHTHTHTHTLYVLQTHTSKYGGRTCILSRKGCVGCTLSHTHVHAHTNCTCCRHTHTHTRKYGGRTCILSRKGCVGCTLTHTRTHTHSHTHTHRDHTSKCERVFKPTQHVFCRVPSPRCRQGSGTSLCSSRPTRTPDTRLTHSPGGRLLSTAAELLRYCYADGLISQVSHR